MSKKRSNQRKSELVQEVEKESFQEKDLQTLREDEIDAMISAQPQPVVKKGKNRKKRTNIASNPSVNPSARKTVLVDGLRVASSRIHPSVEEEVRAKGIRLSPGVSLESLEIPSYHSVVASGRHEPVESLFFQESFQKEMEEKRPPQLKKNTTKKKPQPETSREKKTVEKKSARKPKVAVEVPNVPEEKTTEKVVEKDFLAVQEALLKEQEKALQQVIAQVRKTLQEVRESLRRAEKQTPQTSGERQKTVQQEDDLKKQVRELKHQQRALKEQETRMEKNAEVRQKTVSRPSEPSEKEKVTKKTPKPSLDRKPLPKPLPEKKLLEKKPPMEKPVREKSSAKTEEKIPAKKISRHSPFAKMGLSQEMLQALDEAQYVTPSAIQTALIPVALAGKDVMGQAQTGTGKTAAFAIPILETIEFDEDSFDPQALVLLPTRELAVQVKEEFEKLAKYSDLQTVALYGGKPIPPQVQELKDGVDIVIGTPGRVMDHIKRRSLKLDRLKIVVLDEADRMLDIGFRPDIEKILRMAPQSRQTLLLSATLPPAVKSIAQKYMQEPQVLDCSSTDIASETIEQYYFTVDPTQKFDLLLKLLERENPHQAIIFCRTKRGTDKIASRLGKLIPSVESIHGDLQQRRRDRVMKSFREGKTRILVATDVVGRGIDVSGISHIINYDIPKFCDDYVHRVGRTGRMGRDGVAFTFVAPEEGNELTRIEMRINKLLQRDEIEGMRSVGAITDEETLQESADTPADSRRSRRIRRAL
ncbi:MAG: DEAD/DEAH box helicase [Planctomycetia bacterium]|nr:DEAD/DEAH box helicase [Planctomycetia bacterium]